MKLWDLSGYSEKSDIREAYCRVVKMRRRPALSPAILRFSPAVNCWRKAKNRGLKKSCKVENRIEKEIFSIMP